MTSGAIDGSAGASDVDAAFVRLRAELGAAARVHGSDVVKRAVVAAGRNIFSFDDRTLAGDAVASAAVEFRHRMSAARSPAEMDAAGRSWTEALERLTAEFGGDAVSEALGSAKAAAAVGRYQPADPMAWVASAPPPVDYALPGFRCKSVGLLAGAGGSSKSFYALQSAVSIAVGEDVFDLWGAAPRQGRAVFLSIEDDRDALWPRINTMMARFAAGGPDARGAAFWDAFRRNFQPIILAGRDFRLVDPDRNGSLRATADFPELVESCNGARVVFVDTLSKAAPGVDENDAGGMGVVMSVLSVLAERTGAAVVLIHHVSKTGGFEGAEERLDLGHIRGSSVLTSNSRSAAMMAAMTPEIAQARFGDAWADEVGQWTLLAPVKSNYGPLAAPRWLRRGPDGVLSGAVSPPPSAAAGRITTTDGAQRRGRGRNGRG